MCIPAIALDVPDSLAREGQQSWLAPHTTPTTPTSGGPPPQPPIPLLVTRPGPVAAWALGVGNTWTRHKH